MTQKAFQRGNWQAVIEAHALESHDPEEWLRYGVALLQTLTPGPDVGKQQQQAALAFVQAQKEGATAAEVAAAQRQAVILNLLQTLQLAGVNSPSIGASGPAHPLSRDESGDPGKGDPLPLAREGGDSDDELRRTLLILAGLFDLKLPLDSPPLDQIVAAKQQLSAQKIEIQMIEMTLSNALQSHPSLQTTAVRHLLSLLT